MLADADDIPADARILDGFKREDLDDASIAAFRNLFLAAKPGHPWLALDEGKLLQSMGCWRYDRDKGESGLTLAGLLMFGKHQSIISPGAATSYLVDFRDFRGRKPEERWADRLFPDGTWEANLFQFYQRSWPKIIADLKVPFALKSGQRHDETPVHVALREAFVNAMIHADYKAGGGVVVTRHDDRYQFENPGTLLVSQEQLRRGGVTECRNKSLQRMFMLIGAGELAGSGFARIQDGWKHQRWRAPRLVEQYGPDRVRLDMPMISLMPQEAFDALRQKIGPTFERLTQPIQIALATAMIEGEVTNTRMQDLVSDHPADITKMLRGLVAKRMLETDSQRRWTRYSLPASITPPHDLFSTAAREGSGSSPSAPNSPRNDGNSPQTGTGSPHTGGSSPHSGSPHTDAGFSRIVDVSDAELEALRSLATPVATQKRAATDKLRKVIEILCSGRFLTADQLANLCNREADKLRERVLSKMVADGLLRLRHPAQPNHPDQAYTAAAVAGDMT